MHAETSFKKGSYIFIEGDEDSSSVYLVKKGRVTHQCSSPGLSSALKDAGPGDFMGFISAFSGRPRLSSAVAVEDTIVVGIGSEQLFSMLREKSDIAMKIMNSYSHALRRYDSVLMGINPISLLYPPGMSLLRLGEYYMDRGEHTTASYIFNRYVQLYPDSDNISDIKKYTDDIDDPSSAHAVYETDNNELIFNDRAVIFSEYEPGDMLYFIEEGRVKIIKQSRNSDMLLAVLGEGEIFGELALITNSPRSATAVSFGGARLKPVDMELFKEIVIESPAVTRKIITSISHRLWFNHVRLGQMSYRKPVTRLFAFLETKLMEDGVSLKRRMPHQFQFGLDELISMNELSQDKNMDEINELVGCRYLSFNFGTITVTNPEQFCADVQVYKQRDTLHTSKKTHITLTETRDETGAEPAEDEIAGLVNPEIAVIIPALNDEDPSKRVNAVIQLGNLGERARESVPLLKNRLADDVRIIRRNAARSIISILPPGESFSILREAASVENHFMRSAAISGLGELNIADRTGIIEILVKTLGDRSPDVRSSAVRSLGNIGPEAGLSIPRLIRLLSDNESSVRILAVNALEKVTAGGGSLDEVIDAVRHSSKNDPDRFVKASAREALIKLNRRKKRGSGRLQGRE